MTKKTKKTVFYSSIGAFILSSLILVLVAFGYGYDFSSNKIIKTGALLIKTNTNASVFINDRLRGTTSLLNNSYKETRLLPGKYTIKLESKDYRTWQKVAVIEESFLTEFPSVLLLPNKISTTDLPSAISLTGTIDKNDFITSGKIAYYQNSLIGLSRNQLLQYDIEKGTVKILVKRVTSFHLNKDNIMYLSTDKELYNYSLNSAVVTSVTSPVNLKFINAVYNLPGAIYILGGNITGISDLYQIKNEEMRQISNNVKYIVLSPDEEKLLFYNDHEAQILYLEDSHQPPFQVAGERELITRTTQQISDIQWYKDSEHLILNINKNLQLVEVDPRDSKNFMPIFNNISAFSYDKNSDSLYILTSLGLAKASLP